MKITASYLYSGLPDYWGGDGRRNDNDAGCLFAFYGGRTTLREIIDSAVESFYEGGDFYVHTDGVDPWVDVTEDDVRDALLECLTMQGKSDHESNAIAECALEYAAVNDFDKCRECGESLGEPHDAACASLIRTLEYDGVADPDAVVEPEDCADEDDCYDSPMVVFLLEIETEPDCKGHTVCKVCGNREPQATYDCDVQIVCKDCDK